jgi:membrane protein
VEEDFFSGFIDAVDARQVALGRVLKSSPVGVIRRVVKGFSCDNVLLWASALTYTTALSIVPILAVALSALNGLGGSGAIRPLLDRYVTANSPEITDRIMTFVSNVNYRTLGAVGAASLLFTVILTLGTIEQALNTIFRVVYGRTLSRKFADYLSLTFAVPVLLVAAVGVQRVIVNNVPGFSNAGWLTSGLATWAGFWFLYVFFPNRRVSLASSAIGSLVASILFQFARWAFIQSQYGVNQYAIIYGALASIPILLTWMYIAWVIVLSGAELTAAIERRNQPLLADPWAMSERVIALAIALKLGERMAGKLGAVTPATLCSELGVTDTVLGEVLLRLERSGLVVEASGENGECGLFLGRDSAAIGLDEILASVKGGSSAPPSDPRLAEMVERLRRAERETLGGVTVRDLVEHVSKNGAGPGRNPPKENEAPQAHPPHEQ